MKKGGDWLVSEPQYKPGRADEIEPKSYLNSKDVNPPKPRRQREFEPTSIRQVYESNKPVDPLSIPIETTYKSQPKQRPGDELMIAEIGLIISKPQPKPPVQG